jgi:hypothetical protein
MIKVVWLAVGASKSEWCLVSKFPLPLAYRLQNPPAYGKQGRVTEGMYPALLTNKKQGKNF